MKKWLTGLLLLITGILPLQAQITDTISNWDGIEPQWTVWPGASEVVENPYPVLINNSAHCFKVVTTAEQYDFMSLELAEPINFDNTPYFSLSCYPPTAGGDVVLKFENSDASDWQEIRLTAYAGQWNRLDFDFTGLPYNNYTRMVVFYDFLGTTPGINWYFDDITMQSIVPLQLESNLPIVVINTNGVAIPDEPKVTAHMGIIDNGPGNINNISDSCNGYNGIIGIEIRGQSTQMFPKKSYGFETRDSLGENLNVSLLGFPKENDWILYAPYTDKSLMRNVVTFEMGHRMGDYCTRTAYCEVVINNDYQGIYVLMEKIKKDNHRVDIATLNPDEISGDDVTGGYILSVDKIPYGFSYGRDGWLSSPDPAYPDAMDITFQYYYPGPDDIVDQQRFYIKDYVTNAEKALIASTYKDAVNGYLKYFDAPSFVDFMLLCEISKEVDKYRYSTYFYKQKDSDGGKLFAGPAWDFNLGYGNVDYWPPGINITGWIYGLVNPWDYSIMYWWKRMMEDPYFRNLTKTRWTELRQDKLSTPSLIAIIDSVKAITADARTRNFERWPVLGQYVWPNYNWQNNDYDDEVAYFQNFLVNRLTWMDQNFTGSVLHPYAGISAESNKIRLTLYGDYFSQPVLKKKHFRLNDAPAGLSIEEVEYLKPWECLITLSEVVATDGELSVTVNDEVINTWHDLTSNKLATAGNPGQEAYIPEIKVYFADNLLHIHCSDPDMLPLYAVITSSTGQLTGRYNLQAASENTISGQFAPGLYFVTLSGKGKPLTYKVVVL